MTDPYEESYNLYQTGREAADAGDFDVKQWVTHILNITPPLIEKISMKELSHRDVEAPSSASAPDRYGETS